jgi:Co/Zn/Cd efflux system component
VKTKILNFSEVIEIKKLNIWSMNDTQRSLQAEIKIKPMSEEDKHKLLGKLKESFHKDFKIQDSTIELSV